MKYKIEMSTGRMIEVELSVDQMDNLRRLINSDKTSLFTPSDRITIAPKHIVAVEPILEKKAVKTAADNGA